MLMVHSVSAKELLSEYNQEEYRKFLINNAVSLSLVDISPVPGIGASKRRTFFQKIISHPDSTHQVKFIFRNGSPSSLLWQTDAGTLKKAVRWGVINTHAITSRVVAKLGEYRLFCVEGMVKGMISNSHEVKWRLLDHYQDRCEALQELETLINRGVSLHGLEKYINRYIDKIGLIESQLAGYFSGIKEMDEELHSKLKDEITKDKQRALAFLQHIKATGKEQNTTCARGTYSLLLFIKNQMIFGLYGLQGLNQDLSFDNKRPFALTRGRLNDCIENARKEIEDFQPHLMNAITPKHQGFYAENENDIITYDFAEDNLSPDQEQRFLQAISFIEEWDKLKIEGGKATVSNETGEAPLDTIRATRWQSHRNFSAFVKSIKSYLFNIILGLFYETYPKQEETWKNSGFHLFSKKLSSDLRPNEPLWKKPLKFFNQIKNAIKDLFYGVEDFHDNLVIRMPEEVMNDWDASAPLVELDSVLNIISHDLKTTKQKEQQRLQKLLAECAYTPLSEGLESNSKLAGVEYPICSDVDNDPLLTAGKGLNSFATIFFHTFAKDPFGCLVFSSGYALGAAAVFNPSATASLFGSRYVNWFNTFSYTMASSQSGAAIAGGSTQAQFLASIWDTAMHGPSGNTLNAFYKLGEDPFTFSAYVAVAYSLGYVLTNGVGGHPIPWLSEHLKQDLGSVPQVAYPFIGAKFAILLYEGLSAEIPEKNYPVLAVDPSLVSTSVVVLTRLKLCNWLCQHAAHLSKADPKHLFILSRQIDNLFPEKEAKSLKQLLYPEVTHSIAFQVLSHPLSYIPALLRVVIAFPLAYMAHKQRREFPFAPLKRACAHLVEKLQKDSITLLLFVGSLVQLSYTVGAGLIKMVGFMAELTLARINSYYDKKKGHEDHQFFASVHVFIKTLGEVIFPYKAIKSVSVAHPKHTINEIESSYAMLIKQSSKIILKGTQAEICEDDFEEGDFHFDSLFSKESHGIPQVEFEMREITSSALKPQGLGFD